MGLNNEYGTASPSWVAIDIETAPLVNAGDFIDAPDLDEIEAPSNYKDPEKIAAYIADAKVKKLEKHAKDCASKAALDWNVGRIVAIGMQTEAMADPVALVCKTFDEAEASALTTLWRAVESRRPVIGFKIRSFDLPFLVQRSRLLGVQPPRVSLARFDNRDLCDLFDLLTFSDTQDTKVMRHTLARFAQRFGIEHDESVTGAQIPALVAAGEWEAIEQHVIADVRTTVALAARLGIVRVPEPATAVLVA